MSMIEQETRSGDEIDTVERQATLQERVLKVWEEVPTTNLELLDPKPVTVTVPFGRTPAPGTPATLHRIDGADPSRTFWVEWTDADGDPCSGWVYAVEPRTSPDAEPEDRFAWLADHDGKKAKIEALKERLVETEAHRDRVVVNAEEANRRDANSRAALAQFQQEVREVAIRVADEQGWCDSGLNEVLEELGLDSKEPPRVKATITVTMDVTGEVNRPITEISSDWILNSFQSHRLENDPMDSDWEDVSVDVTNVEVTDWEEDD